MKEITLYGGGIALVDGEDFDSLSGYRWHSHSMGYAARNLKKEDGVYTLLTMHVQIMGSKEGFEIDHANGNKLDNRRCNLRFVTHRQNTQNRKPHKRITSSQYKGVSWETERGSWSVAIFADGKTIHVRGFRDEKDAARAYNELAVLCFGEYAWLNVLEEETA